MLLINDDRTSAIWDSSATCGIDVDNITHVINYDLPDEPESYVHRMAEFNFLPFFSYTVIR